MASRCQFVVAAAATEWSFTGPSQGLPYAAQASMRDYRTQLEAKGARCPGIQSKGRPVDAQHVRSFVQRHRLCRSKALDKLACAELVADAPKLEREREGARERKRDPVCPIENRRIIGHLRSAALRR